MTLGAALFAIHAVIEARADQAAGNRATAISERLASLGEQGKATDVSDRAMDDYDAVATERWEAVELFDLTAAGHSGTAALGGGYYGRRRGVSGSKALSREELPVTELDTSAKVIGWEGVLESLSALPINVEFPICSTARLHYHQHLLSGSVS